MGIYKYYYLLVDSWSKSISSLTHSELLSMLNAKAKSKSFLDPFQRFSSNSWESCKSTTTSESSKSSMITEARRSSLNWSAVSTNAESSLPDTTLSWLTSKNGPTTSSPPDSSDISSFQPTKESSPMRNAERDTSEEKSLVSSIDCEIYLILSISLIHNDSELKEHTLNSSPSLLRWYVCQPSSYSSYIFLLILFSKLWHKDL